MQFGQSMQLRVPILSPGPQVVLQGPKDHDIHDEHADSVGPTKKRELGGETAGGEMDASPAVPAKLANTMIRRASCDRRPNMLVLNHDVWAVFSNVFEKRLIF
jgi:hypothetical protein